MPSGKWIVTQFKFISSQCKSVKLILVLLVGVNIGNLMRNGKTSEYNVKQITVLTSGGKTHCTRHWEVTSVANDCRVIAAFVA